MKTLLILSLLAFSNVAMATEKNPQMIPKWIDKKIKSSTPPIEVEKYEFKKATVYLLAFTCCDQGTRELYSAKGKLLCKLPESFAGLDDSKCPGFNKDAKLVANVLRKAQEQE